MQIRRGVGHVWQLGHIDYWRTIAWLARSDIDLFLVRVFRAVVTVGALIRLGNRMSVLGLRSLKNRFTALLCGAQFAIRETVAVWAIRERVNEGDKIGELLLGEALRAEEKLFRARAAFGRHIGIAAVPLEGFGSGEVFERAIIDDIFAEAVGLKVPLQAVDRGVDVAVGAAELPL